MTTMTRTGFICTFTGKQVTPLDATMEQIDIVDIAHALSNVCRYAGHCKEFYSVAQHSVLVSRFLSIDYPEHAAWGLLHDAPEAYLGDIPAPLKVMPEYDFYREAEERLMHVIASRFGLEFPEPKEEVKKWDMIIRETEMRDFGSVPEEFRNPENAAKGKIRPVDPDTAFEMFMNEYNTLAFKGWIEL